jgi:glycosyltransferase involved in cell wall biosynthesis
MKMTARRIVLVTSRYPFSFQEAYVSTELTELARHFERIVVVSVRPPSGAAQHTIPSGVEVLAWPLLSAELLWRALRAFVARPAATLRTLVKLLRSRDPGRFKNLSVTLKALALAQWTMEHSIDHIHAYWISTPATVAMIAGTVSDVPWSTAAHRWDIYERNAFDLKEPTASFIRTISARGSSDLASRMPTLNGRILELRLGTRVPQPLAMPERRSGFHIVCPAAFGPVKGHPELFAALVQLRSKGISVRCTLCGTGPLQEELVAAVDRLGLNDAVEFAGFVPQKTLHEWYRAGRFSAVVLASRNDGEAMMEGIPSALIEAMAFGVPVVATDSGSIGELVDQECGRLAKAGDPTDLARAILDVYLDPGAAETRARRAYERISSEYDVSTQMRKLAGALVRKE